MYIKILKPTSNSPVISIINRSISALIRSIKTTIISSTSSVRNGYKCVPLPLDGARHHTYFPLNEL